MSDTDSVFDMVASLPHPGDAGWDGLTASQQQLVCMSIIEGQVTNGGFHQVYFNDCHPHLPSALAGYRAIGAKEHARIVEEVMAMVAEDPYTGPRDIWPDPDAPDRPEGSKEIGDFDDPWYKLDMQRLYRMKLWHIEGHPAEFASSNR